MSEVAQITSCYLCGSNEKSKVEGVVRDMPNLDIFECKECHLVYLSSQSHVSEGFYEESGMHDAQKQVDIAHWLNETETDDQRRFFSLKELITNKKLLDFGSGNGGFLKKASVITGDCFGVELEKAAREYCVSNSLKVYDSLEAIKDQKFDVITMFHVLEHIADPNSLLKELYSILSEGGKLIVEVPSSKDALLSLYKSVPFSRFTYWSPHLYLFTQEHLVQMGKSTGFKDVLCKQIQRYPLSNHLYWLSKGKPGGHKEWCFLGNDQLNAAYAAELGELGLCDTLFAILAK
ncbi:MAG: class I SAM-dependent methyltransferase [Candidatus Peribacteraceae bacterium]|jgi:cyclopropane fatty-acyl-phospholipid synthase-like methyltransferase|nr:class I SAM-dependent methyltransferase [Candidatus Peribacteraceae bacterium]|tara:strand:+ start:2488 stop:3360 length:873 start_codon:yes stop_codon:yes gene_type:complete